MGIKILLKLFIKTNNKTIFTILVSLIFVLIFALTSLMIIQSITSSYKNFIFKNYIGVFGCINFKIRNPNLNFIKHIKKLPYNKIIYYEGVDIFILNKHRQKLKVIIWDKKDAINKSLYKVLGDKFLINKNGANLYQKFEVIDTGFLYPEATIFLNTKTANRLHIKYNINRISINIPIDKNLILKVKNEVSKIALNYNIEYSYEDVLTQNRDLLENLQKIKFFEKWLFVGIIILTLMIVVVSLFIFLNMKKRSIFVIRVYGLSSNQISSFFAIIGGIVLGVSLFVSFVLFKIFQYNYNVLSIEDISFIRYIIWALILPIIIYIIFKIKLKDIK